MIASQRWDMDNGRPVSFLKHNTSSEIERDEILELLDNNSLTVHFQPIFSSKSGSVYGYEALTRIQGEHTFKDVSDLFAKAKLAGTLSSLDSLCRENTIKEASILGINKKNVNLFINICPETLTDPAHSMSIMEEIAEKWHIPKEKIVLEITEEGAVHNYDFFKDTVSYCKSRGYRIAIDDFGSGCGGLKMLSIIEPDFIKIDRHFISNINLSTIKYNLVDSVVIACNRIGIKVIAEGIERQEELDTVLNLGIDLLQGYYLAVPEPVLNSVNSTIPGIVVQSKNADREYYLISDISGRVEPIQPSEPVIAAFKRFTADPELKLLPVVEGERIVGILHRNRFLENQVIGKYGFGFALNTYKTVAHRMEHQCLLVEANTPLEEVAQRIQSRKSAFIYDDICVTKNGKYHGTVALRLLLDALTERNLILAKGANPLTGLPGNEFIQREVSKRLSQNMYFDVCYIDIDNFKPYNDHYGFERGDFVITTLAGIITEAIESISADKFNFVGHIGGDDFIIIARPQISIPSCEKIISKFKDRLIEFHNAEDYRNGFYKSKNRAGKLENFDLLSLSIGIVSTELYKIESYAELASIATEVKKGAKMQKGSSIVRDRRIGK